MNGKEKCKILKEIRRQIAEKNDIEWVVSECKHQGNCKGTCPKCESEVRKLEQELSMRRKLGKAVAVTGISAACMAGLTGCTMEDVIDYGGQVIENIRDLISSGINGPGFVVDGELETCEPEPEYLEGDVPYYDDGSMELEGYVPAIEVPTEEIYELDGDVAYEDMD